jgi:RNase P/RNase MRP subunit p29
MKIASFSKTFLRSLLGAGVICMAFALGTNAQVQSQTKIKNGPATQLVKVQRGEVVYVSGNDVVIKGEDGQLRAFSQVPDNARLTVDGQQLSVHDLKVGMTIERTTITTTTPAVITTIKTVTGTVWSATPPTFVILTLEDGKNQQFKIPKGTKFTIEGKQTDAFGLQPGMKVTATAVTEVPETLITKQVKMTGQMPPAPMESINPDAALLVAPEPSAPPVETATAVPTEAMPARLPKTGSILPMVGLLGGLFCFLALGLKLKLALALN